MLLGEDGAQIRGREIGNSLYISLLPGNLVGERLAPDCPLRQYFWIEGVKPHQFHGQFQRRALEDVGVGTFHPSCLPEEMVTHLNFTQETAWKRK